MKYNLIAPFNVIFRQIKLYNKKNKKTKKYKRRTHGKRSRNNPPISQNNIIGTIENIVVYLVVTYICMLLFIFITDSAVDAVDYIRNVFGSKLENKLI